MNQLLRLGITDLSFHHVTGSLLFHVLTDMGFDVARVYSKHEENFNKLRDNDIDMLCSAWLPSSHGIYKSN